MHRSEKLEFQNGRGETLAARLERPPGEPRAYAIFAHCFTCSKDSAAAARVSRALAARGIAVLRFDFTGLGGSEGDFANTSFSSNVADLVAAAEHLREHHGAPTLLVGHSLGGAAVLAASRRLPEVRAVATIGAPSEPAHVRHLLVDAEERIEREGRARVEIAGRPFEIARGFLEDLDEQSLGEELGALRAALLVLHSPLDDVVGIEHAERIYRSARGYRSFVTLVDADHLLTRRRDAEYAAETIATWASRYLELDDDEETAREPLGEGEVRVTEHERPYTTRVEAGQHVLLADEPARVGGADRGPTPYGYLLAGLGSCTSMTLRMYADRKQWPLEGVSVVLRHERIHVDDCERCTTDGDRGRIDRIERDIEIVGDALTDEQRARLLEIADRCPVHRTLENEKEIVTRLV